MTCAIREGAEQKIWKRLKTFEKMKRLREARGLHKVSGRSEGQTHEKDQTPTEMRDLDSTSSHPSGIISHSNSEFVTSALATPSSTPPGPLQLGVLGCMAERLKTRLVEETKVVDVVCGPDAYRDLPRMLAATPSGHAGVNVLLSLDETYADVMPVCDQRMYGL